MRRVRLGAILASALVLGAVSGGCDDGGGGGGALDLTVRFVSPEEGTKLDCGDDLDRDTVDVLEFNVEAHVELDGNDPAALSARLTAEGFADFVVTASVGGGGQIVFGNAALPLADQLALRVAVLDGEDEVGFAERTVGTGIDLDDPECKDEPEPEPDPLLAFEVPGADQVFGADDDADGNLANGIQTDVRLTVQNLETGDVTLEVDGDEVGTAAIADGAVAFAGVALPIGDGERDVRLVATVADTTARAEVRVRIEIDACTLALEPQPAGDGCDLLADADVDPNTPGVQTTLRATSNCERVFFTVNGSDSAAVEVEDGEAELEVTLQEGENTVSARTTTDGGLSGRVEPYVLVVDAAAPAVGLALDAIGTTTYGYAGNERLPEGGFRVVVAGTAEGVAPGTPVEVTFDPPLPGAGGEVEVQDDGTFTVTADAVTYGCLTLSVATTDDCGNEGQSPAYEVCFDPVEPTATLVEPVDGTLTAADDADPGARGIQKVARVCLDDERPADVDYEVFVECQAPGQAWSDRFTRAEDRVRRSDADGEGCVAVTMTFAPADQGTIRCRGGAEPSPNDAVPQDDPRVYTVVTEIPTFNLTQPSEGQCFATGDVVVGGTGRFLTANGAVLEAVVTPEGGAPGAAVGLDGQANDVYAVTFGAPGGPEALPEGRYTVQVSGRIRGDVPVTVAPAEGVAFLVDLNPPVVELVTPAPDSTLTAGEAEDADGDASNCVQTELQLRLQDLSARRLCYALNGSREFCQNVDEDGEWRPQVDLLQGDNVLVLTSTGCAGRGTRQEFHLQADNCPARIVVAEPVDGSRIAPAADVDAATPGLQLDVRLETGLDAGTEVVVAVLVGDEEQTFGPAAVDEDGAAVLRVTVELPADPQAPFEFRLQGRAADGSSSGPFARITVIFVPPTLSLPDLGPCVNAEFIDASIDPGFQVQLDATTADVEPGTQAALAVDCGAAIVEAAGSVRDDGSIEFAPVTLPEEADCTATASLTDAAGQTSTDRIAFRVDRVGPVITIPVPRDGSEVGRDLDEDQSGTLEAQGIQLTPRLRVCGAAGDSLSVVTEPALEGSPFAIAIAGEACQDVELPRSTLPLGSFEIRATATDACGNEGEGLTRVVVSTDAAISIRRPNDQARILAHDDGDVDRPGCQVELVAVAQDLGAGARYFVCTDADQGPGPAACDGRSSPLDPEGCVVALDEAEGIPRLTCPLTLSDGRHTITVVGELGDTVESPPISVAVDCTAPSVGSIAAVQDENADACLNRMERKRPGLVRDRAELDLRVRVDGIEEGRVITLHNAAGGQRVTSAASAGGVVDFPLDLEPGEYAWYVSTSDVAGNPLPVPPDPAAQVHRLRIDTVTPRPQLVGLAADQCLNASADEGAGAGLQYTVRVTAGGQAEEMLLGALALDGGGPVERAAIGDQLLFPDTALPEGARQLAVTVSDACGNVGSVAGFEQVDGLDDWSRPRAVSFQVDTEAPNPILGGVSNGDVLEDDDDADVNPDNGFQLALSVDFDPRGGVPAGAGIEIRTGGAVVATTPARPVVPENMMAPVDVVATLPPGEHSLSARASDACGNEGRSAAIAVTARLSGCLSSLTFAENPVIFGPTDGAVANGRLTVAAVDGQVDVGLNPDCQNAQISLLAGDAVLAGPIAVGAGGAVRFANVALARGTSDLRLRAELNGRPSISGVTRVIVDLDAPAVVVSTPAGPDPASLQADNDANPANGLQTTVVARITEVDVGLQSARTATLEVDGNAVDTTEVLAAQSPLDISFADVTFAEGAATMRICVTDAAGNQGCASRQVVVDLAVPGAAGDLTAEIVHPRTTEVELTFAAPGDNGDAGGPVAAFELRRSRSSIADEAAWDVATPIGVFENSADELGPDAPYTAGEQVLLSLLEETALPLNQDHFVAVRAIDDVGRLGPIREVAVDLLLEATQFDIGPANFWPGESFFNQRSMIQRVGDLNGDGRGDAIVAALQFNAAFADIRQIVVILSRPQGPVSDFQLVPLNVPSIGGVQLASFGGFATGVGDIDADGRPDLAVAGTTGGAFNVRTGAVALYFGTDDAAALANADVIITTPARRFPTFVAGIGNFNHLAGDGAVAFNDLAIGGDNARQHAPGSNWVNIIAGRTRQAWTAQAVIDANVLNAATGITRVVVSGAGNDAAGRSMAAIDSDNDGRTELLLSTGLNWGRVHWVRGGNALPNDLTLPVANNGSREIAHLCPLEGPGAVPFWGSNILGSATFGQADFFTANDLDGQGNGDFVVGDYNIKRIVPVNGSSLIPPAVAARLDCFTRAPQSFGAQMNFAGDVNADGETDLIVTHLDDAVVDAFVFYNDGAGRFGGVEDAGQRAANIVFGERFPRRKRGVAGLGDINGDGFDDLGVVYKEPGGALRAVLYH